MVTPLLQDLGAPASPAPAHEALAALRMALDQGGADAARRHHALARRLQQENGQALLGLDDGDAARRPWTMESRPFLIAEAEWAQLEAGLVQRAQVLDGLLADVYGERRLVADGTVPAALLSHNPGYIPAAAGSQRRGAPWLWMLAVDLVRSAQGQWHVVRDHAEVPDGLGFCLEARLIMARVWPLVMDRHHVRRIAAFFQAWKDQLTSVLGREQPVLGLLSGDDTASRATAFEARYLAQYLGLPVLQGEDLTVRDRRVYLRTIEGLRPVDGLLRFMPGRRVDPLDLDGDSLDGVAGLLQAASSGQVRLFNPVGSGAISGPAIHAVLEAACLRLTGEALRLPGLPVRWLGHGAPPVPPALATLPGVVQAGVAQTDERGSGPRSPIDPFAWFEGPGFRPPSPTASWGSPTLDQVRDGAAALTPLPWRLRCFLARTGQDFQVLPGGLVVLDPALARTPLAEVPGAILRDLWVVGDEARDEPRMGNPVRRAVALRRSVERVTSRMAETFYWLGRYLERAEAALRLARAVAQRALDGTVAELRADVAPRLFGILAGGDDPALPPQSLALAEGCSLMEVIEGVVHDAAVPEGVQNSLAAIGFNALRARQHLSVDMWRALMRLEQQRLRIGEDVLVGVDQILRTLSAITGASAENMTHTLEWRFLMIGRRLERALKALQLWRHALSLSDAPPAALLDMLLIQADSRMTYRSRYLARPQLAPTLDLLILDEGNPRSVRFQLREMLELAQALPGREGQVGLRDDQKAMVQADALLSIQDATALVAESQAERQDDGQWRIAPTPAFRALLDTLAGDLPQVHEHLSRTFFTHVSRPQRQTQPLGRQ